MSVSITDPVKPRVGFYDATGCQGCLLSVIFNEDELLQIIEAIDLKEFRFIMAEKYEGELDICFIEGCVVNKEDEEFVKRLRNRSKVVVALGACATHGNIPAMRRFVDEKDLAQLKYDKSYDGMQDIGWPAPITNYIKVEYLIPGCPPDRDEIKFFLKEILLGKQFRNYPDPVCKECKLFENGCLLDESKICLGPITRGGCKAVCTTHGFECYGCRGLTDDANFPEFFRLMESKGIDLTDVKKRMDTFVGLEVNAKLHDTVWQKLH